jgi:hypothetical protein
MAWKNPGFSGRSVAGAVIKARRAGQVPSSSASCAFKPSLFRPLELNNSAHIVQSADDCRMKVR